MGILERPDDEQMGCRGRQLGAIIDFGEQVPVNVHRHGDGNVSQTLLHATRKT